ncbi:inactive serine/threonine-protein kinase VRK3 isoform X2 [Dunckerocampus dactyliophorus]|uniref:inactive serine/threonine-protein kinase VRK3 isoform X2 n=1 Tax=Dunckerocampus dactyliophorus TaxID=161453 RepID=UPI0024063E2A|nr:inactive serine/threonine-protein kinase VRK3 isoform X2 [Dunckerocampus dactyliophorus]
MEEDWARVTFRFCPQCGTKLQWGFKFCPSCGEKIPGAAVASGLEDTSASPNISPSKVDKALKDSSGCHGSTEGDNVECTTSSPKQNPVKRGVKKAATVEFTSPRSGRGKARLFQPVEEGGKAEGPTMDISSPGSSPNSKSLFKAKKAKHTAALEPLENGMEMTDMTGRKWTLVQLLSQSMTELMYQVVQKGSKTTSSESSYILKMGAKDGRIFNEQNFLQRAAKPVSVDKWIKQHNMDLLGIPSCVGFGFHSDSYRFLIFSTIGQSLPSVMQDNKLLPEKTVLHLTCRLLDVLHYIHSNEYVHGDVTAENVYIQTGHPTQVYLVGYSHAFRYCPSGRHVEYSEGRRALPEGPLDFISLDAHKGVAPSRRSDLQSLGYCMLHWHTGVLPWSALADPDKVATLKQRYMGDVPALLSHCLGRKRDSSGFRSYLTAVAALQYTEQPDYSELKAKLSAALSQLGGYLDEPLVF